MQLKSIKGLRARDVAVYMALLRGIYAWYVMLC